MADVEMKDAAAKPEEEKKEEEKKAEEPADCFYGKFSAVQQNLLTNILVLCRGEESPGHPREGWEGEGLQDDGAINQIIQKAPQGVQLIRLRAPHQVLPP